MTPEEHKLFLQLVQSTTNEVPPMGLGTPAWNPNAGLATYHQKQRAQGLSAQQRIGMLQSAGVSNRNDMYKVFQNMHASPFQAFMLNGRK